MDPIPRENVAAGVAIAAGVVALAAGAADLAHSAGLLLELSPTGEDPTHSTGQIAGRMGLFGAELALTAATTLAAIALAPWARGGRATGAVGTALLALLFHGVLYASHWSRGFSYVLARGMPKVEVACALVQVIALAWAELATQPPPPPRAPGG